MPTDAAAWWRDVVGYEVYIRSFADGNDDGVGDLPGLTARLDHLAWLGIEVVWITPFYPSPMVDFGYDVADYCGVHPQFGTLDDFDRLIARADELGLRVVIDIVPNHTSDQHPWFQAARSSPDDPKRDYYLWRDGEPGGPAFNNWIGMFGGSAWSYDDVAAQQYLHLFLPEQPDLNWANPAVVEEFDRILRFWLDRGVSGFRVDVAHAMTKDPQLRDNPVLYETDGTEPRWAQWDSLRHDHDILQPESLEIFRRWRRIVDEYDAVLIGECYVLDPADFGRLLPGDGLHAGFWFKTMHVEWEAKRIRDAIEAPLAATDALVGWVQASHDDPRPPTRFGGGETGARRSLALSTLLLGLPGMPFLYQAEELAISDGVVPPEMKSDPVGHDVDSGRDGCRTPVPWSLEPGEGFSASATPWLPSSHDTPDQTVAGQKDDPASPLHRVRALIALRRTIDPDAGLEWIDEGGEFVRYRRGDHEVIANISDAPAVVSTARSEVVFSSIDLGRRGERSDRHVLEGDEAVILHHV